VGRERELRSLLDAVERATSEHQPQLVTIVGAPGMGKSRLTWEVFQRLDAGKEFFLWRQGR
jgi:predicted ATPase